MSIALPPSSPAAPVRSRKIRDRKVNAREVSFFLTQLSMMLEVGIPVSRAINTISNQVRNPSFKAMLGTMAEDIEEGNQLSKAMAAHPKAFSPIHINMVRSGETAGILSQVIENIVDIQEKNQGVLSQLKTALVYPVVLCIMAILVTIFVLVGILPKFAVFFEGKTHILPVTTQVLMAASHLLREYWWACLLGAGGMCGALFAYLRSSVGKLHLDWLLVNTPVVSTMANNIYTALFLRLMGNMLRSNIPLKEALLISEKSMANRYYKDFVKALHSNIESGRTFALGFFSNKHIQESVKQVIYVGEEVGKLPSVMERLVRYYDNEIQQQFKKLTALIEPVALVFMGVVVWIIVSAVILPMFRLAGAIR